MASVQSFEELEMWKDARQLVIEVYKQTNSLKDYSFKDQMRRATVSVMNNIAEGFERGSNKDFVRFLFISKASCGEVRSMVYIATDLNYILPSVAEELIKKCINISGKIAKLINYLKQNL